MDGYVKIEKSFWAELLIAPVFAVFLIGFLMFYTPFDVKSFYTAGGFDSSFHIVMIGAVTMACLAISRTVYHFTYARKRTLWWRYAVWCIGEIAFAALFAALYSWLFKQDAITYFGAFSYCFRILFFSLVFVYAFHILYHIIQEEDARIEEMMKSPAVEEEALVKFNDEHGRFKLAIDAAQILYLHAEINYVRIYYVEAGSVKEFSLRNSLKSVEPVVTERGIVRCHRSYFLNPRHVKVLRKDKYGFIVAELNIPGITPIPISKNYYETVAELL